jgi:hypothetical protein
MQPGRPLACAFLVLTVAACSTTVPPSPSAGSTPRPSPTRVPDSGPIVILPPLSEPRFVHSATLLDDGRVLIVGGRFLDFGGEDDEVRTNAIASVDVFDPTSETWSAGPPLSRPRMEHTAILLPDNRVLIVGGRSHPEQAPVLGTAEVFDPGTDAWTSVEDVPLDVTTAMLLGDGRVLAIGRVAGGEPNTSSSATFDPATGRWSPSPVSLVTGMSQKPVGTVLDDGRVLVVGGARGFGDGPAEPRAEAAIFDPASETWSAAPPMTSPRIEPAVARLADGRVLVVSGRSSELFNPATSAWTTSGGPSSERDATRLLVLGEDRVLAIGSYSGSIEAKPIIEAYDVALGDWTTIAPFRVIEGLTGTLLRDGRVLITGGFLECRFGQACENQVVLADTAILVPG